MRSRARQAEQAHRQGNELVVTGLTVGAIGLAGAAMGAVCPLCAVMTPAFLGLGAAQKLRGLWLARRSEAQVVEVPEAVRGPELDLHRVPGGVEALLEDAGDELRPGAHVVDPQ